MRYIQIFKKVLIYTCIGLALFLAAAGTLIHIYQDKIISYFIAEANEHIKTPVTVEKFDLSLFENFPQISIVLEKVWIQESLEGSKRPLAQAKHIYCTFRIWDLIKGRYVINELHLEDAEIFLRLNKFGDNNYTIIEPDAEKKSGPLTFQLNKIKLKNVEVNYTDEKREQAYTFFAQDIHAKLGIDDFIYDIGLEGDMLTKRIQIQEDTYFQDKQLSLKTKFRYDDKNQQITIIPSQVFINQSSFLVEGTFTSQGEDEIDIKVAGEKANVQTILSLFPQNTYEKYKVYTSKGDIYFNGTLKGNFSKNVSPALVIHFGCKNASFYHPEYKKSIENVSLTGSFKSTAIEDLSKAHLELADVVGVLEGKKFSGDFSLRNFADYYLKARFVGEVNVKSLLQFFPVDAIRTADGIADLNIAVNGRINDLKNASTTKNVVTSGEILLKSLQFTLVESTLKYHDFNGSFIFNNNDLAISAFSGKIGNSKFLLNGFFKNIISFLAFKDQPISIEADLESDYIDLDELLAADANNTKTANTAEKDNQEYEYAFTISPKVTLAFNCDVDKVKLRRFTGKNLKGQLKVDNQKLLANNITVNAAGGKMKLDAGVDARKKDFIEVRTWSSFQNISIDSMFYIFENFNQDFLVDKHLKGQIFADMSNYMIFDSKLRFNTAKLVTDLEISIRNGELNDFEPMQQLSKYVEEKSLSRMRFSDIKNNIHIENRTIFLPEMEIKSNVTTIAIKGTHTFDQHIDYQLRVPLRTMSKKDKDEAFGAIEDDGVGKSKLFLTIKGTTEDYIIAYDTKAVRLKIKDDIKKERQELKEVFENKGKEKKKVKELNEDEYFDF